MNKHIYLVTNGKYDHYSVDAVFSTHDKAKKYIKMVKYKYSDYRIEKYKLDIMDSIPEGMLPFVILMNKDGKILPGSHIPPYIEKCKNKEYIIHSDYNGFTYFIFAKDLNDAVKITEEKRLKLLLNKKFERKY